MLEYQEAHGSYNVGEFCIGGYGGCMLRLDFVLTIVWVNRVDVC